MRPRRSLLKTRPARVGVGAVALMIPGAAWTVTAGATGADAQPHVGARPLPITLSSERISYGGRLSVTGAAGAALRGERVLLQYEGAAGHAWRTLAQSRIGARGAFRLAAALTRSGSVRVVPGGPARIPFASASSDASAASAVPAPSAPRRVSVGSLLLPARGAFAGGRIAGTLLPRVPGRVVRLQLGSRRGWRTIAATRTRPDGHFGLATPPNGGIVRLSFAGDRFSAASATHAHKLLVWTSDVASWYDDSGATACGFHATYGVANRDLPCGTQVTFRYGGRTVTATVDDRGPFVGGRDWDLNQSTAGALGFDGVAGVDYAIG